MKVKKTIKMLQRSSTIDKEFDHQKMKSARIILLFIAGAIIHLPSLAQPYVDIVNLQYQQYRNGGNITKEHTTSIFLPVEMKTGNRLLLGSSYKSLSFNHQQDSVTTTNLSSLSMQLGITKTLNKHWSIMGMIIPKLNSDFEDISIKDYQFGGILLMTKKVNDQFQYKFGMYYNREFFGNFFVPLIGIGWRISDRLQVFGVLPGKLNIEYKLSNTFYTGVSFRSVTSSYRLNKDLNHNYVREGSESFGLSQMKIFLNFYPIQRLVIYTELGHTAFREYKIHPNSGFDNPEQLFSDFGNSLFVNVGASFRVRFDQK